MQNSAQRLEVELKELLQQEPMKDLLLGLDLAGTFVFAISGAMLGVRRKLDLFGVLALSFVAASAGGIIRDLLIGSVPPAAINDWRYPATSIAAGLMIFMWYSPISQLRTAILLFDAAGLSLFSVAGAEKAYAMGINPFMSALLGMITGIGGGILRDMLVARTPAVLQSDLYALAGLAGASLVVIGHLLGWPVILTALAAATLCFGLRMIAIRRGWSLPRATPGADTSQGE